MPILFTRSCTSRIKEYILSLYMISFTQNLISIDDDSANVCWIVENRSEHVVEKAVAYSNLFTHNFGEIGLGGIKSISFSLPLSKSHLLDSAFISYFHNEESQTIKSNILKNF